MDSNLPRKLNELIEKINIISRQKTTDAICKLAGQHIVEIFDFDYAVISLFDFRSRRIISSKERTYVPKEKDLGITNPYEWVGESAFTETDTDILVQVLQKKRNVKVIGYHLLDDNVSEEEEADKIAFSSINKIIFSKYKHWQLARFYMPIIYRGLKEENSSVDLPIGVIEIGIKEQYEQEFSTKDLKSALENLTKRLKEKYPNPVLLEQLLQLYTDNFAQPCYSAIVEEESKSLMEQLRALKEEKDEQDTYSGLSYEAYATDIIKKITVGLGADYGLIALKTFNHYHINYFDKGTYFSDPTMPGFLSKEVFDNTNNIFTEKSILVHVCEETFDTYYTDDVSNPDRKYVESIKFPTPVRSEMITPIYYENEIVGIVDLYSEKNAFFNPITVALTVKSMELFMSTYMSKKRQYVYNNLIKPTETWNNSRDMYHQLIKLLTDYYYTETISLWVRNIHNNSENEYLLIEGFGENGAFADRIKETLSAKRIVNDSSLELLGPDIDLHYDFNKKENSINRFCRAQGFIFYISLSIKIHNKYEVFINIFSRLDIFTDKSDKEKVKAGFLSREYEFLSQVCTKVSTSLQNLRMTEALVEMSAGAGYTGHSYAMKKIVESAQIAAAADIVALFPFHPETKVIRKSDGIHSNGYVAESDEKASFADCIFRMKGDRQILYTFDSNEECKDFLIQQNIIFDTPSFDRTNFRTVNQIISTCAVRLEFGHTAVGVMFFNYKKYQNLKENNNLRQIILFFSTFSAYQIFVNTQLDYISNQNKLLDERNALKEEELERMIPLITRTQFYNIIEGVSHIIKNALSGILDHLSFVVEEYSGQSKNALTVRRDDVENSIRLIMNVLTIFTFRDVQNKKHAVNIHEIVLATTDFFKIRHGEIQFVSRATPNLPLFLCYKAEFAMIIYNLVFNSITAIEDAEREEGHVEINTTLSPNGRDYIITIYDNGKGISHKLDEKIYEPNFTTKKKGTGLGLYYIRKTVESYGGKIEHESVVREYTIFRLTIPTANNYID